MHVIALFLPPLPRPPSQERPDASYGLVAVDFLPPAVLGSQLRSVSALLAAQRISPLRAVAFPLASVAAALRTLAQASHAGKVVACAPPASAPATHGSALSRARVAITGGTGGLGLLVARWMAGSGTVGHLRLISRGGRPSASDDDALAFARLLMAGSGACVSMDALDASCAEDAVELWRGSGSGAGDAAAGWDALVHASGVLDDAMLPKQASHAYGWAGRACIQVCRHQRGHSAVVAHRAVLCLCSCSSQAACTQRSTFELVPAPWMRGGALLLFNVMRTSNCINMHAFPEGAWWSDMCPSACMVSNVMGDFICIASRAAPQCPRPCVVLTDLPGAPRRASAACGA